MSRFILAFAVAFLCSSFCVANAQTVPPRVVVSSGPTSGSNFYIKILTDPSGPPPVVSVAMGPAALSHTLTDEGGGWFLHCTQIPPGSAGRVLEVRVVVGDQVKVYCFPVT